MRRLHVHCSPANIIGGCSRQCKVANRDAQSSVVFRPSSPPQPISPIFRKCAWDISSVAQCSTSAIAILPSHDLPWLAPERERGILLAASLALSPGNPMTQRRYQPRQRQQRPRSTWATLFIPLLAIIITGGAFYFFATMLGRGSSVPTPTPAPPTSTPTPAPTMTPTPELATPIPTLEPTLAVEITPTTAPVAPGVLQVGGEATVNAESGLRVRGGPGTNFEQVTTLAVGTVVEIVDGPQRADTYTWWKIRFPTEGGGIGEGWAAGDFLDPGAG